jgi:hypothetical protein
MGQLAQRYCIDVGDFIQFKQADFPQGYPGNISQLLLGHRRPLVSP